uniref:Uncharacterized protein n=1 Tax=Rhizophora mucronata TaxID=61149 RepID=A0A2P2NHR8_RHIMU
MMMVNRRWLGRVGECQWAFNLAALIGLDVNSPYFLCCCGPTIIWVVDYCAFLHSSRPNESHWVSPIKKKSHCGCLK